MRNSMIRFALAALATTVVACGGGDAGHSEKKAAAPAAAAKPAAAPAKAEPAGYTVTAVTDGGSVTGHVTFVGEKPEPDVLPITKDTNTCGSEKSILTIRTGTGGELADAVVWIDGIASGKDFASKDGTVDQKDCEYTPHVQSMASGSTLNISNSDAVLHNIHAKFDGESLFNMAQPNNAPAIPRKLKQTGPVELRCDVHSWMQGWVFLSNHPYVAVTGADGSFNLGDIPPGTYKLKAWHEELGELEFPLTVEASGAAMQDIAFQG